MSRHDEMRPNAVRTLTRRSFVAGAASLAMLPVLGGCKDTDRLQERIIDTTAEEIDETLTPVRLSKLRAPQLQDERKQQPEENDNDRDSTEDEPDNQDRNNQASSDDLPDYDSDPTSNGKTNSNAATANADDGKAGQGTGENGAGGVNGDGGSGAQEQPTESEEPEENEPEEANSSDDPSEADPEEPTPTNPVTPGETYGEDGNYKKLPRATNGIAAVGQYALIVQMLGGKGALKATNADFLDNMPAAAFSNGAELEDVQVAWKGDGSTANDATVKAIIDSGADVALTSPSAGDLSDYADKLTEAGVNVVTMPVIGVCNAYDSDITNTVLYIGELLKNMEVLDKPKDENTAMRFTITPAITSGKDVLTIEGLAKSFGENHLFSDIDIFIQRGEHVALIGANGTGKTTLLKILNEKETADAGTIRLGTNVEIGYYDQEQHNLDMEKTILDEIWDAYPDLNETTIRNTLAAFLFTGEVVYRKVENLSGGERGRLSLAKLMLSDANFLILDEPTNHLDMESREILEDALDAYEGTVLFVSHDRYFINKTADRILHLDHRQIRDFHGNYDYYLEKCREEDANTASDGAENRDVTKGEKDGLSQQKADLGKADWKEQKAQQAMIRKKGNRLRAIEEEIMHTEEAIEEIEAQYLLPEIATNSARLNELSSQQKDLSDRLEELYAEWETLED